MRPPTPPRDAAEAGGVRTQESAGRKRRIALIASLAFMVIAGLSSMLVFGWASQRARDQANLENARDVAALQGLVSELPAIGSDRPGAQLSQQRQAELDRAVSEARESLDVDRADSPARPSDRDTYLLIAAVAALLGLAVFPIFVRLGRAVSIGGLRGRKHVVRAIRRGIERGEFELHYQPQIDIENGRPVAAEALLRWRRHGNLVPPGEFLGDAEDSGAIGPLTHHVLELALAQAARWHAAGREIRVAVNLSALNLHDFAVVEHLERLLAEHQVPASMITVEVTETAVLEEPEQTRAVLDAIAELGSKVSVDDFGTGYSSLLWLRLFPVTEVKIDRTFVSGMGAEGEAYVSGVVRLGHDLELTVVAEGIEDAATLVRLQEIGCDIGQGFLFSKAVPAEALESWLDENVDSRWAADRQELSMDSDQVDLDAARRLIEQSAGALGFDDTAIWDMKSATTEALTNAIEHGSPSADGKIHLRIGRDRGDVLIEVWGGGKANGAPHVDATHRGRGIAIMTALMDDVELLRNNGGTVVRLVKHLPAQNGAGV
jgi:EAL domain-containing protein (putative c-di-GMP-specific phosphodiesterase class I)/anti-sigma regulatory factor (Ser/Thr protein kinase)